MISLNQEFINNPGLNHVFIRNPVSHMHTFTAHKCATRYMHTFTAHKRATRYMHTFTAHKCATRYMHTFTAHKRATRYMHKFTALKRATRYMHACVGCTRLQTCKIITTFHYPPKKLKNKPNP